MERPRTSKPAARHNAIWNDRGPDVTRSFRLMINYSILETHQAEIGPGLCAYAVTHMPTWRA